MLYRRIWSIVGKYSILCCDSYSVINGYEPSSPSLISSTGSTEEPADDAVQYCQCTESDDEACIECQACGSLYEPGTYCPLLCDFPIAQL
jgi:hypothetical protein